MTCSGRGSSAKCQSAQQMWRHCGHTESFRRLSISTRKLKCVGCQSMSTTCLPLTTFCLLVAFPLGDTVGWLDFRTIALHAFNLLTYAICSSPSSNDLRILIHRRMAWIQDSFVSALCAELYTLRLQVTFEYIVHHYNVTYPDIIFTFPNVSALLRCGWPSPIAQ